MDGQNFENGQNQENTNNYYQDYTNTQYQAPYGQGEPDRTNGMQIAGLVLGILGIPACCCYGVPGILFGVLGLIFSIVGNRKTRKRGIGIAGIVCSVIAIVFGILSAVYFGYIIQGMMYGTGPFGEMIQDMIESGYFDVYYN